MGDSMDREENVDSGGSNQNNRAADPGYGQVYRSSEHENVNQVGSQQNPGQYAHPVPGGNNAASVDWHPGPNRSLQQSASGPEDDNKHSDDDDDSEGQDFEDIESIMQY